MQKTNVNAVFEDRIKKDFEGLIDSSLRVALQDTTGGLKDEGGQSWFMSVLKGKAV